MKPTIEQVAAIFKCAPEQARRQYARNARQLRRMATRGPLNGFTQEQMRAKAVEYEARAKQ